MTDISPGLTFVYFIDFIRLLQYKTKKMKEAGEQALGSFFSFDFTFNLLPAAGELCEERLDPCLSQPCTAGSTCDALPQGGFICMCPPGRKGKLCHDCK